MPDKPGYGLSRHDLEDQLRWLLLQRPSDPDKLAEFLGGVMVKLILHNNQALERRALIDAPIDSPPAAH